MEEKRWPTVSRVSGRLLQEADIMYQHGKLKHGLCYLKLYIESDELLFGISIFALLVPP